jgi:hypothetical protein
VVQNPRQVKRLSIAVLVFVAAAAVAVPQFASGARRAVTPAYYPYGPQINVPQSTVTSGGWVLCWSGLYNDESSVLAQMLHQCSGSYLLLAGGPVGTGVFDVVAAAPRLDVLHDTGTGNTPHNANGSGWYFNAHWSWGFAKQGDSIDRTECDTDSTNCAYRLCWHVGLDYPYTNIGHGWRSGNNTGLNDSTDFWRAIYMAPKLQRVS